MAGRVVWVDAVRGLAILLMLLDHVLFQTDPHSTLRAGAPWSITRLSLPLFMLASAAVWRSQLVRWRLLAAAALEAPLLVALGMPLPGIVWLIAGLYVVLSALHEVAGREVHPYVLGVVGLVQALYVPIGWDGYEPGLVLLWWALGRLACRSIEMPAWATPGWLAVGGRNPLAWYLGHLSAIAVAVAVV